MSFINNVKRSKPLQGLIVIALFIAAYFLIFSGSASDSYTPEEINSMLQNKNDAVEVAKVELLPQAIKAPYLEKSNYKSKNWDLKGNTIVKNNDYIRLTGDIQRQTGNIFSKFPIKAESFEMELTFHIHGKTNNGFVGDGMAIWFLDKPSDIGDVFGAQNNFNGLGIMIDTYKNGKRGSFPYVNIMMGNGQLHYDKDTDGFETRIAGCKAHELLNPKSQKSRARIVYVQDGYFSLDFDYNGNGEEWHNCVTLTKIMLPPVKYLGLSAETGGLSAAHDVLENKMYELFNPDGTPVKSIQELEKLVAKQATPGEDEQFLDEQVEEDPVAEKRGGGRHRFIPRKRLDPKKRRKTVSRLLSAEKRLKERERQLRLEKYGDAETTFFTHMLGKIWKVTIYFIYFVLVVLALWFVRIVYRVQRQKGKPKTTGLLD
ncbi:hypothetical protein CLIB1423_01S10396 [[Candida] railenensis]|uniref:L-type lectin-like domain-containing protein n=1 Tax=[Candida] railenensis TaxID=45579 RepID=A0A9P0QKQ8_9ASCO|nr:hypothetical protein CLIB1423_01S10396 [[Candida] railenensis]